MAVAARILSNPASIVWEVWEEGVDLPVGVMVLANINPGVEAHVHFAFFDGKLRSKKELMDELVAWTFAERDGWVPPKRLTTEIPDYAFALAKFAHRHMGFGGDYTFTSNGQSVNVEGVRRKAVRWRGADRDVLLMGRLRDGA